MFTDDPSAYTNTYGNPSSFDDKKLLKSNYSWFNDWKLDITEQTDKNGWTYGKNFTDVNKIKANMFDIVRMRRWIRKLKKI